MCFFRNKSNGLKEANGIHESKAISSGKKSLYCSTGKKWRGGPCVCVVQLACLFSALCMQDGVVYASIADCTNAVFLSSSNDRCPFFFGSFPVRCNAIPQRTVRGSPLSWSFLFFVFSCCMTLTPLEWSAFEIGKKR